MTDHHGARDGRYARHARVDRDQADVDAAKVARVMADLDAIAADAAYIVDLGRSSFDQMVVRRAAVSVLIDVDSAVARLPQPFRDARPDIPWGAIRAMRNILAHDYETVRDQLVWDSLVHDVPDLVSRLRAGA